MVKPAGLLSRGDCLPGGKEGSASHFWYQLYVVSILLVAKKATPLKLAETELIGSLDEKDRV
jgi:hypothetical protein